MIDQFRVRSISTAVLTALFLSTSGVTHGSLIINGDFEAGNTGFSSAHSNASIPGGGRYEVINDPNTSWSAADSFGDHTSGSGLMFVADSEQLMVWQQTVNGIVNGQQYEFGHWVRKLNGLGNESVLQLEVNEGSGFVDLGSIQVSSTTAWVEFTSGYTASASGNFIFRIVNLTSGTFGNNFALDDISLNAVPEPSSTVLAMGLISCLSIGAYRRKLRRNRK
ncbi:hypothetical protein [Thalassoglobus sp.]|uniref:hypothetical protein n=1 Tax=Thalassoglobus sp. TaxID=2795869 RepID=UPI003AA97CEC